MARPPQRGLCSAAHQPQPHNPPSGAAGVDTLCAGQQGQRHRLVYHQPTHPGRHPLDRQMLVRAHTHPCTASHLPTRYVHDLIKYEFDFQFDVPATYPATAPEIELPALEGKTAKMYRGGKICLTIHFKPLWSKNRQGEIVVVGCCTSGALCASTASDVVVVGCCTSGALCASTASRCSHHHSPHFGFAHALCLGLAPWLAAEIPFLVETVRWQMLLMHGALRQHALHRGWSSPSCSAMKRLSWLLFGITLHTAMKSSEITRYRQRVMQRPYDASTRSDHAKIA